jgi:hypothetical protein
MSWNISYYTRNMSKVSFLLWSSCQTVAAEWLMACFQRFHPHTHTSGEVLFSIISACCLPSELPVFDISTDILGWRNWLFKQKAQREKKPKNTRRLTRPVRLKIDGKYHSFTLISSSSAFQLEKLIMASVLDGFETTGRRENSMDGNLVSLFNKIFNILLDFFGDLLIRI